VIEGTVINSVLSPGVWVQKGAMVSNAVVFSDNVIEENAVVDLAILDKRVQVGAGAVIGYGDDGMTVVNKEYPKHLYTGISLIGQEALIPPGARIGRNCIVRFGYDGEPFAGRNVLPDGQSA
jgi:glucose-1-phosphate adenylyltransferase